MVAEYRRLLFNVTPGMAGSKIAAAIHTPLSGFIDPMLLCHAFANAAQKKGVVLLENHDAQRIEKLRDFSKRLRRPLSTRV